MNSSVRGLVAYRVEGTSVFPTDYSRGPWFADQHGWISINPEVSLQMEREPVGEWLCNASVARFTDDGIGVSEAEIFDRTRRVGRSSKSVINSRR